MRYFRASRLFKALEIGRGDGSYAKQLAKLARTDLLIIDDFGIEPLPARSRNDLLELMEDRYAERSVLVTSQLEVKHWHKAIGDPTLADRFVPGGPRAGARASGAGLNPGARQCARRNLLPLRHGRAHRC